MGIVRKLVLWATRFRRAEAGVAAVEFALILPIMLFAYIGMVEASTMISVDRKVQSVSGAVGDLVARSRGQITSAELGEYMKVAGGIMTPYPAAPLEQIVTQVKVGTDRKATVEWSKRYVSQTAQSTGAYTKGAAYTLPSEIINIALGEYVIVAESRYSHTPLYGFGFNKPVTLYRQNFYLPRFGGAILLDPPN